MRKLLVGVTLAVAFWTGRVRYVTTVTYQRGIACEYQYGANRFWRVFVHEGICPQEVEVE